MAYCAILFIFYFTVIAVTLANVFRNSKYCINTYGMQKIRGGCFKKVIFFIIRKSLINEDFSNNC